MTVRAIEHIGITVPDLEHAISPPGELPGGDAGAGNRYLYARTPWGSTVELVTYPSPQAYQAGTALRRWRPPAASDHTRQES